MPRLSREPRLDGIRGFAVLMVLGHNLGWKWLPGGFFGVDVFFSLSGFLITTLLLEEHAATGKISLGRFFARRGLRLYPALVVLVAFSVASVFVLHPPATAARVTLVALSVLGYFSNWVLAFDPGAWAGGMAHTWSLAIEVHFYLLWSLLVIAITRRRGADLAILGWLALMIALGSGFWRAAVWWQGWDTHLLYASTPTRLDSVFLGAGAALIRLHHFDHRPSSPWGRMNRWLVRGAEAICLAGIACLAGTVRQDSPVAYLGGFSLVGAATALLILTSLLTEHSFVARVASNRILAWFGVISYSIYLWHVPMGKLLSLERIAPLGLSPLPAEILRAMIMIAIGAGSYYGIERYFLRLKHRLE